MTENQDKARVVTGSLASVEEAMLRPSPASPFLRKFNFHPVPNAHEQDNPGTKSALSVLKTIAGLPHGRL